jgi:MbtH protein
MTNMSPAVTGTEAAGGDFRAVMNDELQYSVWPGARALPAGWRDAGHTGSYESCLDHIAAVWTDLRPLSAREV